MTERITGIKGREKKLRLDVFNVKGFALICVLEGHGLPHSFTKLENLLYKPVMP